MVYKMKKLKDRYYTHKVKGVLYTVTKYKNYYMIYRKFERINPRDRKTNSLKDVLEKINKCEKEREQNEK